MDDGECRPGAQENVRQTRNPPGQICLGAGSPVKRFGKRMTFTLFSNRFHSLAENRSFRPDTISGKFLGYSRN
jgi:hypothetical protein